MNFWRFEISQVIALDSLSAIDMVPILADGNGYPFYNEDGQKIKSGDCLILADYVRDESIGVVRALGLYTLAHNEYSIEWRLVDNQILRPTHQGIQHWAKRCFKFTKSSVERHELNSLRLHYFHGGNAVRGV